MHASNPVTFKSFVSPLTEGFKNLFHEEDKKKFADEAFAQIHKSYEKVGGIHGAEFANVDTFIQKIPFWKLRFGANGEIIAGAYYKDKGGRKRVAVSSNNTPEGKKYVAMIMVEDLRQGRSYGEVSSASLAFLVKMVGYDILMPFIIPPAKLAAISGDTLQPVDDNDPELKLHPKLKPFFYSRLIGGEAHTKIALGTVGKHLT